MHSLHLQSIILSPFLLKHVSFATAQPRDVHIFSSRNRLRTGTLIRSHNIRAHPLQTTFRPTSSTRALSILSAAKWMRSFHVIMQLGLFTMPVQWTFNVYHPQPVYHQSSFCHRATTLLDWTNSAFCVTAPHRVGVRLFLRPIITLGIYSYFVYTHFVSVFMNTFFVHFDDRPECRYSV